MRKLVLIFFLAVAGNSFSQTPFFQSYSLLKKNEQVNVNVMFQDKKGFIWFGSDKGLFKFNSLSYQHFTIANGLPDNNVTALAEDSTGHIWIGYKNGEITFLENNNVKKFNPPEGHAKKEISDILFDHKGQLWFSSLDEGLYYFSNDRLHLLDEIDGMPDKFIYDLELDNAGKIWAGTDRGLVICTLVNDSVDLKVINNTNGLSDNIIKKIIATKDKMWLASEDAGIFSTNDQATVFRKEMPNWNFGSINDFMINDKEAVISLEQKGLLLVNLEDRKTKLYNSNKGFESINSLLRDREGNIWLGSSESVIRLPGHSVEHYNVDNSMVERNVTSLCVDKNENVWYSLNGKLFFTSKEPHGEIRSTPLLTEKKWQNFYVSSLYADSSGFIWVGFLGQGLARIESLTKEVYYFDGLKSTTTLSITGDGLSIWVASLSGAIRIKEDTKENEIKYFDKSIGLSSDYIYQVFVDSKKRVWFGTDGNGVDMLDVLGIHHYQEGLNTKVVYGFAEDGMHNIWVNIQGEGLYKFTDSKFIPFSAKNNELRDPEINCLASDAQGNLVMMHDLGIDIYDVRKNKVFHIGEEIGLWDFIPNLNSTAFDHHTSLYFGTSRGIVRYSPRPQNEILSPTPRIENLKVIDKKYYPTDNLDFGYNENEITINYIGLWYQNADNIRYQYQLEGFDKNWIESRDHSATYSDLPPGNYSFRLKVSDSDFFSTEEARIDFIIKPPFWRTTVFYVLILLILVVLIFTTIKFRERKLIEEKHFLEAKIQERTFDIQKKNEEIQAQAEEIVGINENLEMLVKARTAELEHKNKALEEYAFITAHELRAPLASILGLVNILTKIKLEEQDKVILNHLKESSERLESIVRTITEAIEKGDEPRN